MSVGLTRSLTEPGQKQLDFVKLHNIAKHIYLLIEGMTAALETLKTMKEFHGKFVEMYRSDKENPVPVEEKVKVGNELLYVEGLFQSTKLKLGSMERRVANMINLVSERQKRYSLEPGFLRSRVNLADFGTCEC